MMEYTTLSHTDLVVSRIGFGCEPLGGTDWGKVDEQTAINAVARALELGVTMFDVADIYGLGKAERVLSQALGSRRHEVVIVSKFGINWQSDPAGGRARTFRDCSPARVVEALEQSLRRLQIDTMPLYLIHWPDPNTPIEATMEALLKCQQEGKIRHIGVSNFSLPLLQAANQTHPLAALELQYNLIERTADQEVLPYCREQEMSVLAYGPLAQGLLTGKYGLQTTFDTDDRRHRLPHFQGDNLTRHLQMVERLKVVARMHQKTPAQVALRWVLDQPGLSCVIVGAKSPIQIEMNVAASGWQLTPEDVDFIENGVHYVSTEN